MPATYDESWRIGHFERNLPDGYAKTIKFGKNRFVNEDMAQYYDSLSLITKGELFTLERFQEIWNMNTGKNDYLLCNYIHNQSKTPVPSYC